MGLVLEQVLGAGSKIGDEQFINLLDDIAQLVYEQPFQIPGNFTLLGRAAGTLYGLCMGLDPQINFLEAVKPYLARLWG
jgi:predicted unusual protein kinase regulating ubiquinone biosynthesis (AarF/ABC1/UbiB family)